MWEIFANSPFPSCPRPHVTSYTAREPQCSTSFFSGHSKIVKAHIIFFLQLTHYAAGVVGAGLTPPHGPSNTVSSHQTSAAHLQTNYGKPMCHSTLIDNCGFRGGSPNSQDFRDCRDLLSELGSGKVPSQKLPSMYSTVRIQPMSIFRHPHNSSGIVNIYTKVPTCTKLVHSLSHKSH